MKKNKMTGMEEKIGHRRPYDCIKEEEAREVLEFEKSDAPQEEKTARINALMSKARSCPLCKRAILKVFGT